MASVLSDNLSEKAKRVKLLILDVDGVMTDGSIIYSSNGLETKAFNVKDGHGIKLFMKAGLEVAIITARNSKIVSRRASDLGVELLYQGATDKLKAFDEILELKSIEPDETAYLGDDVIDLPVLKRVGFSATVADGVDEVVSKADYVTALPGGRGAVRELVEVILKAQGLWDGLMMRYRR